MEIRVGGNDNQKFFVIINVRYMTVYHLKLYFGSIAVMQCFLYSQITVAKSCTEYNSII